MSIAKPSQMSKEEFVDTFAAIYEHSPWVAERTWANGVDKDADFVDGLAQLFEKTFLAAMKDEQLQLMLAHPDLAGKAAIKGELTEDSTSEQASAGIDQCSPEELAQFESFNNRYKKQFEFPFIKAVKGSNRFEILAAFEERLHNDDEAEFNTALNEINKIARFRLQNILQE
ncbi:MAG: 2-oxo-4-hydroxy-4-carboxy-5-ureidoimidazoline decarboxylase [Granulosicoccaceae bacterium]